MASPVNKHSVDGATSTGAGEETRLKGHYHITLFVVARNLDSANDTLTVSLEGSATGNNWVNAGEAGSQKELSGSDFTEDPDNAGQYTASLILSGTYYEYLRARVVALTDSANGDLEVDAWIMAAGRDAAGQRGNPQHGP